MNQCFLMTYTKIHTSKNLYKHVKGGHTHPTNSYFLSENSKSKSEVKP